MSGLERYEGQDGGATLQCLDPPENTSESRDAWKEGLCHGKQAPDTSLQPSWGIWRVSTEHPFLGAE